jgi:hypothetical protein
MSEVDTNESGESTLILGKFKDQESLEAAYVNLEKLASKKTAPVSEVPVFNEEAELQRLGLNGRKIKETVTNWVNNTFSDSAKEAFAKAPKTAETLQFMDEIRQQQSDERSRVPMSNQTDMPVTEATFQQLKNTARENVDRMRNDSEFMKKTLEEMAVARNKDPNCKAVAGTAGFTLIR